MATSLTCNLIDNALSLLTVLSAQPPSFFYISCRLLIKYQTLSRFHVTPVTVLLSYLLRYFGLLPYIVFVTPVTFLFDNCLLVVFHQ